MEATIRGPRQGDSPQQHTEAPPHIVDRLASLWRTLPTDPTRPHIEPGTPEYAAAVRAEVRRYANLIWAEAFHAGAAFGLAWKTQPIRIVASPEAVAALVAAQAHTEAVGRAR